MQKFIQLCLLFTFAVIFSTVSADAQSVTKIDTKIPFEFKIGAKSYQAGNYQLAVSTTVSGNANLTLRDASGNTLERIVVNQSGKAAKSQGKLVFNRYDNERYLSEIVLGNMGFSLIRSDVEKDALKKKGRAAVDIGAIGYNLL